jgi:hypothetical protein
MLRSIKQKTEIKDLQVKDPYGSEVQIAVHTFTLKGLSILIAYIQ